MKIAIGSDHAAYQLKQVIIQLLKNMGHEVTDMGAYTDAEPANDYHLIGASVSEMVVAGKAERGIVMCGSGIGISIAANKVPGADCALCNDLFTARKSREHNDANVLALGARVVGEEVAKEIVTIWMQTEFTGDRHTARNANIRKIEQKYCNKI